MSKEKTVTMTMSEYETLSHGYERKMLNLNQREKDCLDLEKQLKEQVSLNTVLVQQKFNLACGEHWVIGKKRPLSSHLNDKPYNHTDAVNKIMEFVGVRELIERSEIKKLRLESGCFYKISKLSLIGLIFWYFSKERKEINA